MTSGVCLKEQEEVFDALDDLNRLAIQANRGLDAELEARLETARTRYKDARAALTRCEDNKKRAAH